MSHRVSYPHSIPQNLQLPCADLQHSSLFSLPFTPKTHHPVSFTSPSLGETGRWSKRVSWSPILSLNRGSLMKVRCEERDHGFYMRRCVEIARKAVGCTSPNPMVGCVIVKDGEIVGEGFHPKAGQPHAEVFALKDAGDLAENATAYVSLEPCNHYGRTPPCTGALIGAKVKHVVVGMVDPNPIVASKGVERLRESGIDVIVGVEEMLCRKLNEAYIHRMITGKPFVTLRYSLSVSGRFLNKLGNGAEESGGYYSRLLQEYDGVLISCNSLTRTSPLPTSRETGANQLLRIIIARGASSLIHLPSLILESSGKILVLVESTVPIEPGLEGMEVVVLEQLNLSSILDYCARRGLCSVLIDLRGDCGGLSELLEEGLEGNLVQKVVMEVQPSWNTSEETNTPGFGRKSLISLKELQSSASNESIVIEGYVS